MEDSKLDMVISDNVYGRTIHTKSIELSHILKSKYKTKYCMITPSGLGAISSIIQTLSRMHNQQINLLYGNELYCDTPTIFSYLEDMKMVKTMKVNITN